MSPRTAPVALTLAVALGLGLGACSSIEKEVARDRRIDQDLAVVTASGVPGASIVVRHGDSTSKVASGVGEVATKAKLEVDDKVRIGSVAKPYIAVVVLQLAEEKKLALDDSVERLLPGMVPKGAGITVRQLLNHTSGIPNYEEHPDYMAPYLAGDFNHVTTPAQLVAMGTSFGSLFPPGTASTYSNTNYTLAGLLIEKVTGTDLGTQLDKRIFGPLGLKSTSLPTTSEIAGRHAHGYFVMGAPPATDVTRFSPSIGWAGGSIISTTTDVTTFVRALLEGRLVRPESLAAMMTTVTQTNGETYGLGLARKELPCGTAWGHQGNFPGYFMETWSTPDADRQVTVAYNLDSNSMQPPTAAAAQQLLHDAFCGVEP